jgi:hypothetical protein
VSGTIGYRARVVSDKLTILRNLSLTPNTFGVAARLVIEADDGVSDIDPPAARANAMM